jgi:hypothetical protein
MKKVMLLIFIISSMMLSACSILEGANQSLQYADQAKEHINKLADFAEQAPQMIQDAASNPEAKQNLENQLNTLRQDIEQFNLTDAPALAKDLHQEIVDKNQLVLNEINNALASGNLALDKLQNSQIVATINDITSLINRIENLGL